MRVDKTHLGKSQEFRDILSRIPDYVPTTIIDVGANVGDNATAYANAFPDAVVHAFEPVGATFDALKANVAGFPNVHVHNLALGDTPGTVRMWTDGTSPGAFIIKDEGRHYKSEATVTLARGDDTMAALGIDRISYLKIDAEGHDLNVVNGFGSIIETADFVQVEAGMNPHNKTHVPFRLLEDALRERGFLLFRFYEQSFEFFFGGRPVMRRTNPVFVNARIMDLSAFA